MWDAVIPVELTATALLEGGNEFTELGMYRAAVVALVIVFQNDFTIGCNVVGDRIADYQITEGVS